MMILNPYILGGVTYLLRDLFTTDASAPLSSPRTCEPGPNTLTLVQTSGNFSIVSGEFTYPVPSPTGTWQNMGFVAVTGIARATGRAYLITSKLTSGSGLNAGLGFYASSALVASAAWTLGFHFGGFTYEGGSLATTTTLYSYSVGTTYTYAVILRSTGALFLVNDGSWQLLWVSVLNTTATLYPAFESSSMAGTLDNARVVDLGGSFATDYGIATTYEATSSANDVIGTTADCIIEHTFTAATGVTKNILVRRLDDSNCWVVRCDQTGATIKLFEKNAGVETERATSAFTWTNGSSYRVMVTATGATIRAFAGLAAAQPGAAKNSYASATFQQTQTGAKVDHAGTNFTAWPRNPTLPNL